MKELMRKRFLATGVGSVPHKEPKKAVEIVLKNFPEIPFWPQMPKRSFYENMYAQYIEGFPNVVINEAKKTLWIDTSKDFLQELSESYQKIINNDIDSFSISKERAAGFYEFLDHFKKNTQKKPLFVKGHITGPISFGLSVTDQNKKPILYNADLADFMTKALALKIKWQIKKLKEITENVIIFIDEPYLVSLGSSYVNIKRNDAQTKLKELVEAVHNQKALAGIHCCGNTDWAFLMECGIDILNLDAYNYINSISLYPDELNNFLDRGSFVAWGIVPTSKEITSQNARNLGKMFEDGMELLINKNVAKEKLLSSSLITPSCGCGSLDINDTQEVLSKTAELSELLRSEFYG